MITILHGGQTGVDRGAHEAALGASDWSIAGYMPRDGRDELGKIPEAVARHLQPCPRSGYGARTEMNVAIAEALLIVVRDEDDPRATPGTAKTIDLARDRKLPRKIVDPSASDYDVACWIRALTHRQLGLDGGAQPLRLMIAGPRESKWTAARVETAGLLRRVALELWKIQRGVSAEHNRRMPRLRSSP